MPYNTLPEGSPVKRHSASSWQILIVAAEASGDLIAAQFVQTWLQQYPQTQFIGIAGPRMRAAGVEPLFFQEDLSVMGVVEVIKKLPTLWQARRTVLKQLKTKPDLYLGIDAPDFNLPLAAKAKALGIRSVHYNSPTVWAWRPGRIHKIKRCVDHMLLQFPFEKPTYDKVNLPATYVGHALAQNIPLADQKTQARERLHISKDTQVLALLPGSRTSEIQRLLPIFLQAAKQCCQVIPELQLRIPLADASHQAMVENLLSKHAPRVSLETTIGNASDVMAASDCVLLASGTATLEAMLLKRPMVVAYRLNPITYQLVKPMMQIQQFALPNILNGEPLVPEFIQAQATPEALSDAVLSYLNTPEKVQQLQTKFTHWHQKLRCDTAAQVTEVIIELLAS